MKKILVAPSILACKKPDAPKQIYLMQQYGADWLHFDVMDGQFVPNTTFSSEYLKAIDKYHHLVIDTHLMVVNPMDYIDEYANAGSKYLTFHYESFFDDESRFEMIRRVKEAGMKVGMSIKPNTPASVLYDFIDKLDLVLVMSVEPGFGGQKFMDTALRKIAKVKAYKEELNPDLLIEVDGGINNETGPLCVQAGADVLVAGSYLFYKDDIGARINRLKGIIK